MPAEVERVEIWVTYSSRKYKIFGSVRTEI